jgi:hypothetical protein
MRNGGKLILETANSCLDANGPAFVVMSMTDYETVQPHGTRKDGAQRAGRQKLSLRRRPVFICEPANRKLPIRFGVAR